LPPSQTPAAAQTAPSILQILCASIQNPPLQPQITEKLASVQDPLTC
jgi:hypothetical protein